MNGLNRYSWLALLLAVFSGCASDAELSDPRLARALAQISPGPIEAQMRVLAADDMQGRGTGTVGYLRAADYLAAQFEAIGFAPAGDGESFFQSVPLRSAYLNSDAISIALVTDGKSVPLVLERDLLVQADFERERAELTAPLAFVGFGVVAADQDYNDYADLDVTGKVVVMFRGAPKFFPGDERALYASSSLKLRAAIERGAVGVLEAQLPDDRRRRPWDRVVRHSKMPAMRWVESEGKIHEGFPELFVRGQLGSAGERTLFEAGPVALDEVIAAAEAGRSEPFDLASRIAVSTSSRQVSGESPNVIGLLRGSDPRLADETVVLTAHLDHVGVGDPVDSDGIHNGAYDNASGISMLLAIGGALADLDPAPRRSIMLLAVTGEEKGLLGSEYFTHHPTVPLASIVANINLDMVLMFHPLVDLVAFGAGHSSLGSPLARSAAHLGVELSSDPIPERVFFIRSDQFSFVKQGVPSVFTVSGFATPDSAVDGKAQFDEWMGTIYHSPGDDMSQSFDFEAGALFARVNFLTTYLVANDDARPTWNPGDFFGRRFSRGASE